MIGRAHGHNFLALLLFWLILNMCNLYMIYLTESFDSLGLNGTMQARLATT